MAKFVGVGERRLKKADEIVTAAEQNPKISTLVDEMDAGKKVGRIYRKYIHDVKTEEQLNTTSSIPLPKDYDIRLGNFIEILKNIPDNSIDFIITDPPYADTPENLLLYRELAKGAYRGT